MTKTLRFEAICNHPDLAGWQLDDTGCYGTDRTMGRVPAEALAEALGEIANAASLAKQGSTGSKSNADLTGPGVHPRPLPPVEHDVQLDQYRPSYMRTLALTFRFRISNNGYEEVDPALESAVQPYTAETQPSLQYWAQLKLGLGLLLSNFSRVPLLLLLWSSKISP